VTKSFPILTNISSLFNIWFTLLFIVHNCPFGLNFVNIDFVVVVVIVVVVVTKLVYLWTDGSHWFVVDSTDVIVSNKLGEVGAER